MVVAMAKACASLHGDCHWLAAIKHGVSIDFKHSSEQSPLQKRTSIQKTRGLIRPN